MRARDLMAVALGMALHRLAGILDDRHRAARREARALLARIRERV